MNRIFSARCVDSQTFTALRSAARRSKPLVAALLALALVLPVVLRPAHGNLPANPAGEVTEASIKAAFLYRFIGYVEWPSYSFRSPETPYTIAVMGSEDMADKLSFLVAGRSVGSRTVEVRQVGPNDPLQQVHVLYIGDLPQPQMELALRRAQQQSILSVTDAKDGQLRPSVIQFKLVDNRVRFDVALDAAERSNLKISSRMLVVAHQVKRGGP